MDKPPSIVNDTPIASTPHTCIMQDAGSEQRDELEKQLADKDRVVEVLRASLAVQEAESARLRLLGEQLEHQVGEAEERVERSKSELDEMASRFRQAAREVERVLGFDRAVREALEQLSNARPAARWLVNHADRAHEYDRPYAQLALEHVLAAEQILKETVK